MGDIESIQADLLDRGILIGPEIISTPITGGVSSDIFLLEDGVSQIVVKRALSRLRVNDEWIVDTGRNRTEQEFIRRVASFLPCAMPKIVHYNNQLHYFAMEYLQGYSDWKSVLLAGRPNLDTAQRAGSILGALHRETWQNDSLMQDFNSDTYFHALRTEPYLLTCAARHPQLQQIIHTEARRLEDTRLCLIHGDYSPKNIMVNGNRVVILDCEVGCFGEPAFDLAFLLNHFLLKALLHKDRAGEYINLVVSARRGYASSAPESDPDVGMRTARLLLILMLARIDGEISGRVSAGRSLETDCAGFCLRTADARSI